MRPGREEAGMPRPKKQRPSPLPESVRLFLEADPEDPLSVYAWEPFSSYVFVYGTEFFEDVHRRSIVSPVLSLDFGRRYDWVPAADWAFRYSIRPLLFLRNACQTVANSLRDDSRTALWPQQAQQKYQPLFEHIRKELWVKVHPVEFETTLHELAIAARNATPCAEAAEVSAWLEGWLRACLEDPPEDNPYAPFLGGWRKADGGILEVWHLEEWSRRLADGRLRTPNGARVAYRTANATRLASPLGYVAGTVIEDMLEFLDSLYPRRCRQCQNPLPEEVTVRRAYCSAGCKQKAYEVRQHEKEISVS
jgi:hypothetical protein